MFFFLKKKTNPQNYTSPRRVPFFVHTCTCPSIPCANHSWNEACESKSWGMIKCKRAHSSAIEFWIGVPVSSNRFLERNPRSVFHRWELELLRAWASSATIYCHRTRRNDFSSATRSWYDVTRMWKGEFGEPKRWDCIFFLSSARSLASPQYGKNLRRGVNLRTWCLCQILIFFRSIHISYSKKTVIKCRAEQNTPDATQYTSSAQLGSVLAGATTTNGPHKPLVSAKCWRNTRAWIVFPSPISSARIPLRPCS